MLTFTSYVRSLDDEPLTAERFGALLAKLRGALVHELKTRGLWGAPPCCLGIYGGTKWTDGDLLEDLLLDCYQFVFVRRLPGLQKQALVRPNVDGLVFRNLRNFLSDAQRRHDPLGYRVFEVTHAAVSSLRERGALYVLAGDPRVRNDTVLASASWHDPAQAEDVDLRPWAVAWNDALWPELITAWNKDGVASRLAALIAGLPDAGIEAFRFRDLLEPLKEDVRARWHALLVGEQGETALDDDEFAGVVPLVRPDHGFEDRQRFEELRECVDEKLERLDVKEKTREYLRRLWTLLRYWATEELEEELPPDTRLGKLLGIPRGRIPELKATLGGVVEGCRETAGASAKIRDAPGADRRAGNPRGKEDLAMALEERREELRQATVEVAVRTAAHREALARRRDEPPRPGDTFVVAATRAFAVEWLVLELDPDDPHRLWVAPFDDYPLVGSRDVAVAGADGAVAHVRCGVGTWVGEAVFDPELRTGTLGTEALGGVRRRSSEITKLGSIGHAIDDDPEYRSWMETLEQARSALPRNVRRFGKHGTARPSRARIRIGYALAATFAAATVGLSVWVIQLQGGAGGPVLVGSSKTREIRFLDDRRTDVLTLSPTESYVTIYLVLSDVERFPAYRLELRDADGKVVWSSEVDRDPHDELLLMLPRRLLSPGTYELRLSGLDEERLEVLDEREIRVEAR